MHYFLRMPSEHRLQVYNMMYSFKFGNQAEFFQYISKTSPETYFKDDKCCLTN